jgi:amino-acid N-acetyltransferase
MAIADLRGILHYVPQFRGQSFVIALDDPSPQAAAMEDLLLDLAVLASLQIKVVLVVDLPLHPLPTAPQPIDAATLEAHLDAAARVAADLLRSLASIGLPAAATNAVSARPAGIIAGKEQLHRGQVDRIAAADLRALLDAAITPVVVPVGYDDRGRTFALDTPTLAAEVALSLQAAKLIYLVHEDIDAIMAEVGRHLSVPAARLASEHPNIPPTIAACLRLAAHACREGVARTHLIAASHPDPLLAELFDAQGIGLMIHSDSYLEIRRAAPADLPELVSFLSHSVERQAVVRRSKEDILRQLDDFFVCQVDGAIVASIAIHEHQDALAEIACLNIKRAHQHRGYGRELIAFALDEARRRGCRRAFLLTTQAEEYFREKAGFSSGSPADLPPARRAQLAASARSSHVLVRDL